MTHTAWQTSKAPHFDVDVRIKTFMKKPIYEVTFSMNRTWDP